MIESDGTWISKIEKNKMIFIRTPNAARQDERLPGRRFKNDFEQTHATSESQERERERAERTKRIESQDGRTSEHCSVIQFIFSSYPVLL